VVELKQEGVRRPAALVGIQLRASSYEMRRPRYSTMRVPFGMVRAAKTPRPWIFDRRTTYGASLPFAFGWSGR